MTAWSTRSSPPTSKPRQPAVLRGTWALGQASASIVAGSGRADSPGPNISKSGFDDVQDGSDRPDIGMGCYVLNSNQVTTKSRHTGGGVNVIFADGHVQFIHDGISTMTYFQLHSRNDGKVINENY